MFCKQCGAKVEVEEAAFCQECGTPIDTQKNENTLESLSKHIEYKNDERIKELKSRLSTGDLLAKADIGEKEKQNLNIERVKEGVCLATFLIQMFLEVCMLVYRPKKL